MNRWKVIEKANPLAVHCLTWSKERGEDWIDKYGDSKIFTDKTITKASFVVVENINTMRTETIEKTFALFEELSEEHKEKAIEDNRDFNVDHDWWRYVYDDAKEVLRILGFEVSNIYFSGFWSQGDGACFESSFSYEKGMLGKIKAYAPKDEELHRLAKEIQGLYARSFYTTWGKTRQSGHYSHEYSMSIELDCEKGSCEYDDWKEIIADVARWIYGNLESEYEHLTSDEVIAESLICNEVEFEV